MADVGARERIRFQDLGDTLEDHCDLRADLRERVTSSRILAARTNEALVRAARDHFEEIPGRPDADVDEFASAVLARLGVDLERTKRTLHENFVLAALGFQSLPSMKRESLLEEALQHLSHVESLIALHESSDVITEYVKTSRVRDRKLVDFYQRCLEERAAISRYLATGLDLEALRRADENDWVGHVFSIFREEPPYRLRGPRGDEYLDHRLINWWRHRVRFLPLERGRELGNLYATDRQGFYATLLVHRPVAKLFEIIDAAAARFERVAPRAPIFAELQRLFASAQWYGLYALALPQVEGLFTEMGDLATPRGSSGRGLKEKVRNVRRYAAVHENNLDYFEYVVPGARNSFAHTGTVNEPELGSLELLHDLAYVCEVFTELDAPVVELCNLLAEPTALQEIHQWARVFELVEKVTKEGQRAELGTKLEGTLTALLPDDTAKSNFAKIIGDRLRADTDAVSLHLATMAKERLGVTLDLAASRKSQEVHERTSDLSEMIGELDAMSDGAVLRPLDVRSFAEGVLEHAVLGDDVRTAIKDVLAEVARPLNTLASILREGSPKTTK